MTSPPTLRLPRLLALGLGIAGLGALAACGGGDPAPTLQAGPVKTAAACRVQTHCDNSGGTPHADIPAEPFPDQDTALDKATPQLRLAWTPLGVSVIPGKHVFDAIPKEITVNNRTAGKVKDDDARRWANGALRENALDGWAMAHKQLGLRSHLQAAVLLQGTEQELLGRGATIQVPPCALYPTSFDVVPLTDHAKAAFGDVAASAGYALVMAFSGPCTITADVAGRKTQVAAYPQGTWAAVAGEFRTDGLLGDLWYGEAAAPCSGPTSGACA